MAFTTAYINGDKVNNIKIQNKYLDAFYHYLITDGLYHKEQIFIEEYQTEIRQIDNVEPILETSITFPNRGYNISVKMLGNTSAITILIKKQIFDYNLLELLQLLNFINKEFTGITAFIDGQDVIIKNYHEKMNEDLNPVQEIGKAIYTCIEVANDVYDTISSNIIVEWGEDYE